MRAVKLSLIAFTAALAAVHAEPAAKPALTCASCHVQAKTQPGTAMAHAIEPVAADPVLRNNGRLEAQRGPYRYAVTADSYSVTDGKTTKSLPIQWPFGRGSQTFLFEENGHFMEGLMSFYPGAHGLDTTIGDNRIEPHSVEEAFGRPIDAHEARSCFGCHATNAVSGHQLTLQSAIPGVSCGRCHTGVAEHLRNIGHGSLAGVPPPLKKLSAEDTSSFCGQCHRTWQTVVENRWMGIINVRFQPYRLAKSKCYDGVDSRMSCTGCHNPHEELVRDDAAYDGKCLACHGGGPSAPKAIATVTNAAASPKSCPVSKNNCVTCHMPKVDLPGAHRAFADHYIRVVKANEPYPE